MRLSRRVWTTATLLHLRQPIPAFTICTERCFTPGSRVLEGVTTSHWYCSNYIGCQCDSWWDLSSLSWSIRSQQQGTTIPYRRLLASNCQPLSTPVVRDFQVFCSQNTLPSRRSCIRRRRTTAMEQSVCTHPLV